METIIKNGKRVNVNYGGKALQERMIKNGWRIELAASRTESPQELYNRLSATGAYADIKVYWDSTMIRGLHDYFALVKRK